MKEKSQSAEAIKKDRYRVKQGEPGQNIVTPLKDGDPIMENPPALMESSPPPSLSHNDEIGQWRTSLVLYFSEESAKTNGRKRDFIKQFLREYNRGSLLPDIYEKLGPISSPTLYRWVKAIADQGFEGLVPRYGGAGNSKILPGEKDFLLRFLNHQNQPKISDAIKECKRYLGEYSTSGPSTLRRFVNQFKTYHNDTWTLRRKGEKAWNDEVAPYQDRDPMLLSVGDVIVADGHKLNLNVLDPVSGKKKRATLVLFWDWKSTYPLGWEITFSENTQCITVALRNALLTLGKIPSNIYIDNGKAFLSKIFTRKIRIEDTEIPGMIERLGSRYRRAMRYHGQSKPIERFFRIINDRLERRLPSYTGSSVKDKPAYLLRNENLAKQLHDNWTPTVDDVFNIMLQWREEYIDEPRPRRGGLTARQLFEEGRGAGLDPMALCFLVMAIEIKTVRRNRFTFAGTDWEGRCLYGYKGRILIRYSLSDFSKIYVFDINDRYLGTVEQCGKADPIKDWQAAKRIVAERRKLKRDSKQFAAFLVDGRRNPELLEYIEAEEAKRPRPPIISPYGIDYGSEPGEFPSGEQNLIETKRGKNKIISPFSDEPIQQEFPAKDPCEKPIIVDPRTGLSRPNDGTVFRNEFEYYEWYRLIEEKFPGILNDTDWEEIEKYQASAEWEDFYGRRRYARMERTVNDLRHTSLEPSDQEDQQ